jgi:hypothetical protein
MTLPRFDPPTLIVTHEPSRLLRNRDDFGRGFALILILRLLQFRLFAFVGAVEIQNCLLERVASSGIDDLLGFHGG